MKICVQGLWHLGTVTAACLASIGHNIVGLDYDEKIITSLNNGKPTIFEPGLEELLKNGLQSNKLTFASEVKDIEFLWITYDTPVDDDDNADVDFVVEQILKTVPNLKNNATILVSSQMPIGSIKKLENIVKDKYIEKNINFAYSPENLRLGNALNVFLKPDRIVVGTRLNITKEIITSILEPLNAKIEWMSVESAEMTKHAINSFLATSVVFANEIATICEMTGADAKEVERGLKSEQRIGYKAYLSPGVAFSGGTLARDIEFLKDVSYKNNINIPLLESVKVSNDIHKSWMKRKIQHIFPILQDVTIAIWGITYKAGTDTLRRSMPVELCNWLLSQGSIINIYDPIVKELPPKWNGVVQRFEKPLASLNQADILLLGTECKEYKEIFSNYKFTKPLTIIDPNRFLLNVDKSNINYISIGTPLLK